MVKLQKAAKFSHQFIDYKIGIAGAIVMGGIVFSINYFSTHEITGSVIAAIKQGSYTFLFGGIFMKVAKIWQRKLKNEHWQSWLR